MNNSDKICFVSVTTPGCDHRYLVQQGQLAYSIEKFGYDMMFWTEEYPPGSRTHYESLYGFKVHAVKAAYVAGYRKIVWIDTACILQKPCEDWFEDSPAILAARDDNKLRGLISEKAEKSFGPGHGVCDYMHLVGGSLYVFDFSNNNCEYMFNRWAWAEREGLFGATGEKLKGHRHDEACMAFILYETGFSPVSCVDLGYNSGPDSIVTKHHFK